MSCKRKDVCIISIAWSRRFGYEYSRILGHALVVLFEGHSLANWVSAAMIPPTRVFVDWLSCNALVIFDSFYHVDIRRAIFASPSFFQGSCQPSPPNIPDSKIHFQTIDKMCLRPLRLEGGRTTQSTNVDVSHAPSQNGKVDVTDLHRETRRATTLDGFRTQKMHKIASAKGPRFRPRFCRSVDPAWSPRRLVQRRLRRHAHWY